MKAKGVMKTMIQGNGEPVVLDQEGIPVHDLTGHGKPAADGNEAVFSPLPL